MLEARRHHRQLRATQRDAVALRRGDDERLQAIAYGRICCAPPAPVLKRMLLAAVQVFALIAMSQLAFRIACLLTLPGPAGVAGTIMLLGFLSSRFGPSRWAVKGVALLRRHWAPVVVLAALGIAAGDDLIVIRQLAPALTLLAGTAVSVAITRRMQRGSSIRLPRPWTRTLVGIPSAAVD